MTTRRESALNRYAGVTPAALTDAGASWFIQSKRFDIPAGDDAPDAQGMAR